LICQKSGLDGQSKSIRLYPMCSFVSKLQTAKQKCLQILCGEIFWAHLCFGRHPYDANIGNSIAAEESYTVLFLETKLVEFFFDTFGPQRLRLRICIGGTPRILNFKCSLFPQIYSTMKFVEWNRETI
jgi:hypothetical protein